MVSQQASPASTRSQDLVQILDDAPMGFRYWCSVVLLATVAIFDFFDLFVVGFLVSVVGPEWQLTYAQIALVLLSAGVGSIFGSVLGGMLADRLGRKKLLCVSVATVGFSGGSVAFIPEGSWILFVLLRFFVGVGVGGAATLTVALVVEYTPTRARTWLTSALSVPAGAGILLAAGSAAYLLDSIGWRGLAALGFIPCGLAVLCLFMLPESTKWLIATGRQEQAKALIRKQHPQIAESVLKSSLYVPAVAEGKSGLGELFNYPRYVGLVVLGWLGMSIASYGVVFWGPTIIALFLSLTPGEAAGYFVVAGLSGILGRAIFSFLAHGVGRVKTGIAAGVGTAAALAIAAVYPALDFGGYSVLVIMIVIAAFFYEGGAANITPYAAELFPVRVAARATGLATAAGGVGRILAPLCLALIAGAGDIVTPQATAESVRPAFLFLSLSALVAGVAFLVLGVETRGKPIDTGENGQASIKPVSVSFVPGDGLSHPESNV